MMFLKYQKNYWNFKLIKLHLSNNLQGMIKFKIIEPKELDGVAKLTVHLSGKLGLSASAAKLIDVLNNKYCMFALDSEDKNKDTIYLITSGTKSEKSFNISKAGDYYYIKGKSLLNDLNVDYSNNTNTIIFDIYPMEIEYENSKVYKLKKRVIIKNKKAL